MTRFRFMPAVLLAAFGASLFISQAAQAQLTPPTDEQRKEFFALVAERDKTYRDYHALVAKVVEDQKAGRDTLRGKAQIENLRDQLDVREERLNKLSIQYGIVVPNLPDVTPREKQAVDYFVGGDQAVRKVFHEQGMRFAKKLNFKPFLAELVQPAAPTQ